MRSVVSLAVLSVVIACSASGGDGSGGNGAGGSGNPYGGSGNSGGSLNPGAGGTGNIDPGSGGGSGTGNPQGDACAGESFAGEQVPVDVFVMFDQSASMNTDQRWQAVTGAITQFFNSPQSAGLGVGIQFFGRDLINEDCDPASYAQPQVPIASLPGNANALINAIGAHAPSTQTPTAAALTGAISFARQWKSTNETHTVVVLLVTDGVPEVPFPLGNCLQNPQNLQTTIAAATQGAGQFPQVPTYVIGVGANLANLNQIAAAGGSQQAYIIDGTQDVTQKVLDALEKIRGSIALPCQFQIPPVGPGGTFDPKQVNVFFTPGGGQKGVIFAVPDAASCDANRGGWYFDNPQAPTTIHLCDKSCTDVTGVRGTVDVQLRCPTIPIPPA